MLSDVDIAVLFETPPSSYDRQIRLGYALTDLFGVEVDIIDLDRVRLELRARVLQEGGLLHSSDEPRRVEFQVHTLSAYLDFKPYQEPLAKAFIARVAGSRWLTRSGSGSGSPSCSATGTGWPSSQTCRSKSTP